MDLLSILLTFAVFIILAALYWSSVTALNRRAESIYGYRPVNFATGLVAMAAYVVAITGISMGGSNVDVGIIASLLIFFSLFIRVAFKASFFIAILALPLLMIGGLGLLAITAILYLIFGQNKESKAQQTNQP